MYAGRKTGSAATLLRRVDPICARDGTDVVTDRLTIATGGRDSR
jgi:hypothetical protein